MALKIASFGAAAILICISIVWFASSGHFSGGSKKSSLEEIDYVRYAAPLMPLDNPSPVQAYGSTRRMLERSPE